MKTAIGYPLPRGLLTVLLLGSLFPLDLAAKHKPKGPTLEETMEYITQTLNTDGKSLATAAEGSFSGGLLTSLTKARWSGCQISYEVEETLYNFFEGTRDSSDRKYVVVLDVSSIVAGSVQSSSAGISFRLQRPLTVTVRGHSTFSMSAKDQREMQRSLDEYADQHRSISGEVAHVTVDRTTTTDDPDKAEQMSKLTWPSKDSDTASRLANALNYAVRLCGGKRDPFSTRN